MKQLLADYTTATLGTLEGPSKGYNPGTTTESAINSLADIVSNILGVLTIVAGLAFIFYFVIGGLQWITSGGERDKVEKAKNQMTYAAIGMIVIVISYGISFIVSQVLGVEILDLGKYINILGPQSGGE